MRKYLLYLITAVLFIVCVMLSVFICYVLWMYHFYNQDTFFVSEKVRLQMNKKNHIQKIFIEAIGKRSYKKYFSIVSPGHPGGPGMDLKDNFYQGLEMYWSNQHFEKKKKYKDVYYTIKKIENLLFILRNSQLNLYVRNEKIRHVNGFTRDKTEDLNLTRVRKVILVFSEEEIQSRKKMGQFYVRGFEIEDSHRVELIYIDRGEGPRALFLKNKEGEIFPYFSYSE